MLARKQWLNARRVPRLHGGLRQVVQLGALNLKIADAETLFHRNRIHLPEPCKFHVEVPAARGVRAHIKVLRLRDVLDFEFRCLKAGAQCVLSLG